MAIYHLEAKVVSRGTGRSAVAASAYLSCTNILNDYDGVRHDYTRKKGLIWREVFLPEYVNKGEHIIIRGENGSGKSTLLKVIAKILDIDSGQITYGLPSIDGIMYVSQNTNLFNRSIYENIIYPMDDANLEEVYELINIFGLNSLITSENDLFQKKPGDFGNKFSGGEKQKILIIRTLINRPHIILFDEITSSLDSNSTKVFYEMLNTRLSSSTVLFVSHDDVVDSAFDRVLEIDELHAL